MILDHMAAKRPQVGQSRLLCFLEISENRGRGEDRRVIIGEPKSRRSARLPLPLESARGHDGA